MKIKSRLFLLSIFSILFLLSCDVQYNYEYQVINNTDTSILVNRGKGFDSLIIINSNSTGTILLTDCIDKPGGPFFRDISNTFDTIIITKKGVSSLKNFKANDSWVFTKKSSALGNYSTTVSNNNF